MGKVRTIGPAAVFIGCTENHLRKLADKGLIPVVLAGRLRVFRDEDLERIRAVLAEHGLLAEQRPNTEMVNG